MFNRCLTILFNCVKVASILMLLLFLPKSTLAQSCECINEEDCAPCEVGFTSMTFNYSGPVNFLDSYTVSDADGILENGLLSVNNNIIVEKRNSSETFEGNFLIIRIFNSALIFNRRIDVLANCQQIQLGNEYDNGNLKIIAAESITAEGIEAPLCCEPEDRDTIPPQIINMPQPDTLYIEAGCSKQFSWTHPELIDDCTGNGFPTFIPPFPSNNQVFPKGPTTITYFARDESNNHTSASFTVVVVDEISPLITNMPDDQILDADINCTAIATWTPPTATDNCEAVELISSHPPNSLFELGETEVKYTAIDGSGNETEQFFNVIVRDNSPPIFLSFPSDTTVSANKDCEAIVEWILPEASDNCSTDIDIDGDKSPGDAFPLGTTAVTYTATDEDDNEVTRSFTITVIDDAAPEFISFPDDMEISLFNSCDTIITWETPEVLDNCGEANLELVAGSPQSGDVFSVGTTYTISYKTTDESELENGSIRSFDIIVLDKQAPVFTGCPRDTIVYLEALSCDVLVEWADPQVTDNCDLRGELESNLSSGTRFGIGTREITYIATDESGNESFCTFNVIVQNNFEPVVENCPPDVEKELFDRAGVRHDWIEPTVILECADLTIESNYKPGDLFPEGTTVVEYYYEINDSIEVFCSFVVNVVLGEIDLVVNQLMTPNGDGQNDFWKINEIENFPKNTVIIVDRWGSEIYKASGYNNETTAWGGSNKRGDLVPTGTYYYFITVEFESSVVKKNGFIELIR